MKVFLIATEFHRSRGGIQYVNRLLARAFEQIAASTPLTLSVFSYSDRPEDFAANPCASTSCVRAFDRSGMRMGLALARALLQQPDMVLLTHVSLLPFLRLVRRLAPRARTAVLTHGIEVWSPLVPAVQHALQQADSVVAPSEYTAVQLREQSSILPSRLMVLPHGLDPTWAAAADQHAARSTVPTLLSVGRLNTVDRPKGIEVVLRAMPHILERVPEARYVVAGDGDDRLRLEHLAASLGVASRVEFLGDVGGTDLIRLYTEADVFVLPSQKEGFGIVFAEAMWLGLPVVAARAGAAEEVVEDGVTGILVPPNTDEQLASAVSGLLLLEPERRRMGAAGRRRVEQHYLFSHFTARWHKWLASVAPEAVYLARHAQMSVKSEVSVSSISR